MACGDMWGGWPRESRSRSEPQPSFRLVDEALLCLVTGTAEYQAPTGSDHHR
jgi:hypothetical protein